MSGGDPKHFFFYGTLQAEHLSAQARHVLPKLTRLCDASVPGRIFAITTPRLTYPVLIEDQTSATRVAGTCFAMRPDFTDADLNYLDTYEEYFEDDPSNSEYLRKALPVELKSGASLTAWVYVYNFALPDSAEPIPSGDFRDYIMRLS